MACEAVRKLRQSLNDIQSWGAPINGGFLEIRRFSSAAHKLWSIIIFSDAPSNTAKRSVNDRPKRLIKIQISNDRIREVDAILRNVTERGAGIELQTELEPGEKVLITVRDLEPIGGTVAWSKQNRAGLEFDALIDPSMLTIKNSTWVDVEGVFASGSGYHVFDRFKPVSDMKRPAVKLRK